MCTRRVEPKGFTTLTDRSLFVKKPIKTLNTVYGHPMKIRTSVNCVLNHKYMTFVVFNV